MVEARDSSARARAMTEPEVRRALVAVFEGHRHELAGVRVVLFGSRARGAARPRSDFDIGLLGPGPVSAVLLDRIEDQLEALPTLVRFELVDLARASPAFRAAALSCAEVLLG